MTIDQLRAETFATIDDLLSMWVVPAEKKRRLVALRAAMNDPANKSKFDLVLDAVLVELEKRK